MIAYYVGYVAWGLRLHLSYPALNPSPQTVDPDLDLSGPEEPNSKRNNSSYPKPGEGN